MKPPVSALDRLLSPARQLALAAALSAGLAAQAQFLGVAAGDTTATSVVLWTRALDPAAPGTLPLTLELATDAAFANIVTTQSLATDAAADFTAKTEATGLQPSTRYYYRFRNGTLSSLTGTFKTAPLPTAAGAVRFAFSGDGDGLMRPYPLASVFPTHDLDWFVFLGDTMYEAAARCRCRRRPAPRRRSCSPTTAGSTANSCWR